MCPLEQTVLLTALSFPGQELTGAAVTPETRLWAVETVLLRKSLIAGVDEVVLRPAFLCGSHSPLPLPPRGSLRGGLRSSPPSGWRESRSDPGPLSSQPRHVPPSPPLAGARAARREIFWTQLMEAQQGARLPGRTSQRRARAFRPGRQGAGPPGGSDARGRGRQGAGTPNCARPWGSGYGYPDLPNNSSPFATSKPLPGAQGTFLLSLRRVLDLSCHVHKLVPSRSVFLHRSLYLQLSSFSSFAGLTTAGPQPSAAGSNNASLSFPDPQDQDAEESRNREIVQQSEGKPGNTGAKPSKFEGGS
ncbi:hypothetical protein H8959_021658 [Pygathrix nigripes]